MNLIPIMNEADLVRDRPAVCYTEAEQQFSLFVQHKMCRLLKGDDDDFVLMRRYCEAKSQVAFFIPSRLEKKRVRREVAEGIIYGVLRFLDPFSPGGPIAQAVHQDCLRETQTFPTQYPHIVVERIDVFTRATRRCRYIEWRAVRLQNQRKSTLVNRAIDIGNLAIEIARFVPLP